MSGKPDKPSDITQSALFLKAAAEAREASRRYWARGSAADRKYPLQEPNYWPVMPIGFNSIVRGRSVHAEKVAGKLLRAVSIHPRFAAGLLHAWNQTYCRPPIGDRELKQIFDRIANREAERLERRNERRAAGQ